jgi:hypothetical protein
LPIRAHPLPQPTAGSPVVVDKKGQIQQQVDDSMHRILHDSAIQKRPTGGAYVTVPIRRNAACSALLRTRVKMLQFNPGLSRLHMQTGGHECHLHMHTGHEHHHTRPHTLVSAAALSQASCHRRARPWRVPVVCGQLGGCRAAHSRPTSSRRSPDRPAQTSQLKGLAGPSDAEAAQPAPQRIPATGRGLRLPWPAVACGGVINRRAAPYPCYTPLFRRTTATQR